MNLKLGCLDSKIVRRYSVNSLMRENKTNILRILNATLLNDGYY